MFDLIVFMLAVVGLIALTGLTAILFAEWLEGEPSDGIPAASRISAAAWEADQALYRAAWKAHNE